MRKTWFVYVLMVLAFVMLIIHLLIFSQFTIDDAFITFTYTRNFLHGHGLVFTRGSRVEATSTMLWALILVPWEAVFSDGAVLGSKILGFVFAIGTLICGVLLLGNLGLRRATSVAKVFYAFFLAGTSSFIVWAVYGMENALVGFLLMLAVWLFLRELRSGGVLSAFCIFLLQTVRPEGFIYIFVFVFMKLLYTAISEQNNRWKILRPWLLVLIGCLAVYEGWGVYYYGRLLPNTVVAKVTGSVFNRLHSGYLYVATGYGRLYSIMLILSMQFLALHFWCLVPGSQQNIRAYINQEQGRIMIAGLLLVHWAFVIATGGDWMVNARFLSHMLPLLIVLFASSACKVADLYLPTSHYTRLSSLIVLVACNILILYYGVNLRFARRSFQWQKDLQQAEERALSGMVELVNSLPDADNTLLACSDVGRPGYMFVGRVLDWWGLADEEIAKLDQSGGRVDPDVVLRRKPDFIVLYANETVFSYNTIQDGIARTSIPFYESDFFQENYMQVAAWHFWHNRWHILFTRTNQLTESL